MTKYIVSLTFVCSLLTLMMFLSGCNRTIEPNTTTIEYGTSENGKNKTNKSIKQTFKWGLRLNGITK